MIVTLATPFKICVGLIVIFYVVENMVKFRKDERK